MKIIMRTKYTTAEILRSIVYVEVIVCLYIELIKCYTNIGIYLNVLPDVLSTIAVLIMVKSFGVKKRDLFALLLFLWITFTASFTFLQVRNNYYRFRYFFIGFVAFYICENYMNKDFWDKILKLMSVSLIIHMILVLYQFLCLTHDPDYINGIFGFIELNNAASGTFCLIMTIIGIVSYIKKTLSVKKSLSLIIMSSIVCAISEIKAYFVLVVIGGGLAFLLGAANKKEFNRRVKIIIIGIFVGAIAINIIYRIMPDNLYTFTNLSKWRLYEEYSTYHIGRGVGRTNQISYVFEKEYKNNILWSLFGKGLGYEISYIPYEMGRFFLNFGILGFAFLLLFLTSRWIIFFKGRMKNSESVICIICTVLFIIDMFVWNATFNRMAIIWFVLFSLLNVEKNIHINHCYSTRSITAKYSIKNHNETI